MSNSVLKSQLDLPIELPTAFGFLSELLPARDLTGEAEGIAPRQTAFISRDHQAYQSTEPLFDRITRILHRSRSRHLVLLGRKGVGKTAVVQELARLAAEGDSFLGKKKLLWFDCRDVGPEDSRSCLESLLSVAREQQNAVLCIEGFAKLFPRAGGGSNGPLIRTAARRPKVQFIGLMEPREYADTIGGDLQMREVFSPIELPEPDDETALHIAEAESRSLNPVRCGKVGHRPPRRRT